MKKTLITIMLVIVTGMAMAQTKNKTVKAPAPVDTVNYHLTRPQVEQRASALNNLIFVIRSGTGDITPNQLQAAVKQADSLFKVDFAWLKKTEPKQTPTPLKKQ